MLTEKGLKIIHECSTYAAMAHDVQFRKAQRTPYISHPARVANLVALCPYMHDTLILFNNEELVSIAISVAWLHDVLEDCKADGLPYSIRNHCSNFKVFLTQNKDIDSDIGQQILEGVEYLTFNGNKKNYQDKINYYNEIANKAPLYVSLIKIYDRIDNLVTACNFSKEGFAHYIMDTDTIIKIIGEPIKTNNQYVYDFIVNLVKKSKMTYLAKYSDC